MMPIRKFKKLLLVMMSLSLISCSTTSKNLPQNIDIPLSVPVAQQPLKCDDLLQQCAAVVQKQKAAIDAQKIVITKQMELIDTQQSQISNAESMNHWWIGIAGAEAIFIVLKLVVGK